MGDNRSTALPEGTDAVIQGASSGNDAAFVDSELGSTQETLSPRADEPTAGGNPQAGSQGSTPGGGLADRFRSGREQIASQANDRARGLVSQGLGRTSEALANVSKMIGDTAAGIEERLGPEYGDYARRAAGAIENVANNIAEKDPDELIDDTRNFVRNSPGVALAGAAVVGFVVARLIKGGIGTSASGDDERA